MALFTYEAKELFQWLVNRDDIVVVDVRNDKDFGRFPHIEAPYPFEMHNVSYHDFMELEEESVARVPKNRPIRIVCAKEGSAKSRGRNPRAARLRGRGLPDRRHQDLGNLLVARQVAAGADYELFQFIRPGKASCSYGLVSGKEMMVSTPRATWISTSTSPRSGLHHHPQLRDPPAGRLHRRQPRPVPTHRGGVPCQR